VSRPVHRTWDFHVWSVGVILASKIQNSYHRLGVREYLLHPKNTESESCDTVRFVASKVKYIWHFAEKTLFSNAQINLFIEKKRFLENSTCLYRPVQDRPNMKKNNFVNSWSLFPEAYSIALQLVVDSTNPCLKNWIVYGCLLVLLLRNKIIWVAHMEKVL